MASKQPTGKQLIQQICILHPNLEVLFLNLQQCGWDYLKKYDEIYELTKDKVDTGITLSKALNDLNPTSKCFYLFSATSMFGMTNDMQNEYILLILQFNNNLYGNTTIFIPLDIHDKILFSQLIQLQYKTKLRVVTQDMDGNPYQYDRHSINGQNAIVVEFNEPVYPDICLLQLLMNCFKKLDKSFLFFNMFKMNNQMNYVENVLQIDCDYNNIKRGNLEPKILTDVPNQYNNPFEEPERYQFIQAADKNENYYGHRIIMDLEKFGQNKINYYFQNSYASKLNKRERFPRNPGDPPLGSRQFKFSQLERLTLADLQDIIFSIMCILDFDIRSKLSSSTMELTYTPRSQAPGGADYYSVAHPNAMGVRNQIQFANLYYGRMGISITKGIDYTYNPSVWIKDIAEEYLGTNIDNIILNLLLQFPDASIYKNNRILNLESNPYE